MDLPDAPDAQPPAKRITIGSLLRGNVMKRPTGVTLIGILIVAVAAVLTLGCLASFFIAIMAITGGSSDPVSAAITGMAIGGGFSLTILAAAAGAVAIAVFRLQEWAWSASIASIGLGAASVVIGLLAFRRFFLMPVGLSLLCHLLVMATAVWMLSYLLKPGVRQAFIASSAHT